MRRVIGKPRPERLAPLAEPSALAFHRGLPGYEETRLVPAPALASELGLERLYVKDESRRFGLPAFKFLGASWAIARLLGGGSDVATLARGARSQGIDRLATATDGNHGRAVARMAALVGLASTIYVPSAMRPVRREAIIAEGAELVEVDGDYDEAVRLAIADARADPACRAVNDADPEGTSDVARWVIDGYSTLFAEIDGQLPGDAAIDVVLLQTGVGASPPPGALGCPAGRHRDRRRPRRSALHRRIARGGTARHGRDHRDVDGRTRRGNTVGGRVADPRRRARRRDRRR